VGLFTLGIGVSHEFPFQGFWAAFLEAATARPCCAELVDYVMDTESPVEAAKALIRSTVQEDSNEPVFHTTIPEVGHATVGYTCLNSGNRPAAWIDYTMVDGVDVLKTLALPQRKQLEKEAIDHFHSPN
jgi:hypothetical protein